MIDHETYARERALVDKSEATMRALWPAWAKGGAVPEAVTAHPDYRAVDNAMRSRVAQYELLTNTPESFVAYIGDELKYGRVSRVTTWAGDMLGTCVPTSNWRVYNSAYGSRMYQVTARVGDREFTGRTFGQGMSVVLRETAASKRPRASGTDE